MQVITRCRLFKHGIIDAIRNRCQTLFICSYQPFRVSAVLFVSCVSIRTVWTKRDCQISDVSRITWTYFFWTVHPFVAIMVSPRRRSITIGCLSFLLPLSKSRSTAFPDPEDSSIADADDRYGQEEHDCTNHACVNAELVFIEDTYMSQWPIARRVIFKHDQVRQTLAEPQDPESKRAQYRPFRCENLHARTYSALNIKIVTISN